MTRSDVKIEPYLAIAVPAACVSRSFWDDLKNKRADLIYQYAQEKGIDVECVRVVSTNNNCAVDLLWAVNGRLAEYLTLWLYMATGLKTHFKNEDAFDAFHAHVHIATYDYLRLCEYIRAKYQNDFTSFCATNEIKQLCNLVCDNDIESLMKLRKDEAGKIVDFLETKASCAFNDFYSLNGGLEEFAWQWVLENCRLTHGEESITESESPFNDNVNQEAG